MRSRAARPQRIARCNSWRRNSIERSECRMGGRADPDRPWAPDLARNPSLRRPTPSQRALATQPWPSLRRRGHRMSNFTLAQKANRAPWRQNAVGGRGAVSYKYRRIALALFRSRRRQSDEPINRSQGREFGTGDRNVEEDADGLVRGADHAV